MFLVQSRNKNFGTKMPFHLPGAYYIFQLGCLCFSSRKMRPRQPKEASTGSQAYKDKLGEHFLPKKKTFVLAWRIQPPQDVCFSFPFFFVLLVFLLPLSTPVFSMPLLWSPLFLVYLVVLAQCFFGFFGCAACCWPLFFVLRWLAAAPAGVRACISLSLKARALSRLHLISPIALSSVHFI